MIRLNNLGRTASMLILPSRLSGASLLSTFLSKISPTTSSLGCPIHATLLNGRRLVTSSSGEILDAASEKLINRTIDLALQSVRKDGGRPFACLVVRNGEVIAEGTNQVAQTFDPSAHAEMVVIRQASEKLKELKPGVSDKELFTDCEFYLLCEPCPMCCGAMYYCSPRSVFFVTTRKEYSQFYTDSRKYFEFNDFYNELSKPWQEKKMPMIQVSHPRGTEPYRVWQQLNVPQCGQSGKSLRP
jgi:guanine deaminase